jgi:hypothetical protein
VYKYRLNKKSWCQYGGNTGANTVSLTGANTVLTKENKKNLKKEKKACG